MYLLLQYLSIASIQVTSGHKYVPLFVCSTLTVTGYILSPDIWIKERMYVNLTGYVLGFDNALPTQSLNCISRLLYITLRY